MLRPWAHLCQVEVCKMDSVTSSMIGKGMMTSSMIDKASELFRICDQEEKGSFSLSKKFDRQVNHYSKFLKLI